MIFGDPQKLIYKDVAARAAKLSKASDFLVRLIIATRTVFVVTIRKHACVCISLTLSPAVLSRRLKALWLLQQRSPTEICRARWGA